jgi:diguanylate cyclase (GGDEF)-like protein
VDLYLRAWAEAAALMLPVEIVDEEGLNTLMLREQLAHGAMLGLFLALFVYNLLIFALLRERAYCYYTLYLLFAYLTITSLDGFGSALLYPGAVWPGNEGLELFSGITYLLILLFTRSFLRTGEFKTIDRILKGLIGISVFMAASSLVLPIRAVYLMSVVMVFVFPLICSIIGVIVWLRGRLEARFYILGQVASWIGLLLFGMLMADILPYHVLLFNGISIGIAMDALLLSLALADRIRILQKARIQAENEARRNLELRREELEQIVAERTDELELARRQAELLATTDELTGILNRRGFMERADHILKLAIRTGQPLSMAEIDLDHFKRINDTYGHAEGDRVLRTVASLVNKTIRTTDIFGRVGGEEFMLMMPNTPGGAATQLAERIRQRIEKHFREGEQPLNMTVSLGVAWVTQGIDTLDTLIPKVDSALYLAKRRGRNRVELMSVGKP